MKNLQIAGGIAALAAAATYLFGFGVIVWWLWLGIVMPRGSRAARKAGA